MSPSSAYVRVVASITFADDVRANAVLTSSSRPALHRALGDLDGAETMRQHQLDLISGADEPEEAGLRVHRLAVLAAGPAQVREPGFARVRHRCTISSVYVNEAIVG